MNPTTAGPGSMGESPLDDCGCCGATPALPAPRNRPGLERLSYRVGTHGAFLRSMTERLPSRLPALTSRDGADPAIALLDAWACLADVLTFYQERIANEGFLRCATERRSILELARAIGYELKPGVAASATLAFTVEAAPGSPGEAVIETGVRVLSVPAQDQRPQTFETIETIEARAEWNALKPRCTRQQDLAIESTTAWFAGVATQLQPADVILLVGEERERWAGSEAWDVRIVESVTPVPERDHTVVTWRRGLGKRRMPPAAEPRAFVFRQRAALFGHSAAEWDHLPKEIKLLYGSESATEWPDFSIHRGDTDEAAQIDLDAAYPQILEGSWLALLKPNYVELYRVAKVSTLTRTGFGLVAKVTRIEPDGREHLSWFGLRQSTVLAQSMPLPLAEEPEDAALAADPDPGRDRRFLPLDRRVTPPAVGRLLLVSGRSKRALALRPLQLVSEDGERTASVAAGDSLIIVAAPLVAGHRRWLLEDRNGFQGNIAAADGDGLIEEAARPEDPLRSELAVLKAVEDGEERTTLELNTALSGWYDRHTVTIHANVARATHGETVADEPLGSGDATIANQRFRLARPPLTHVAAATPSGAASTLEVWVDGVRWSEAPALHGLGPAEERYMLRLDDDGTPRVLFGDGGSGARLPTGLENVRARYRTGIGLAGEVAAGSLTLLQKRPLGIRAVTNPLPASGAADPETSEQARSNAPVTVLSLDRIVSLSDYEDFSRAFAGIGKAQAVSLWNGETPVVHLTVGTAAGEPVPEASDLMNKLRAAIQTTRDPSVPVIVQGYREQRFSIAAKVLVEERRDRSTVHAAIIAALETEFAFPRRGFGQAVTQAEVIARIQAVEGVVAVDLDGLYREGSPPGAAPLLLASAAQRLGGAYQAAELLRLRPGGVTLSEMPT
jgi:uncharacterized phage protein gp47/JayE